ncbi:MAG: cell division protein FtsL [Mariprofundaceae bacterium]|nr:cell division protein FtsL [Mariprofundaceae bacterium]
MTRLNIILLLCCAVLGVTQVWLSFLRNSNAREMHATHASILEINEEMEQLTIESASLMRPDRLRRVAHENIGMRAPLASQVIQASVKMP